jgi:hypothetical protein
VPKKQGALEEKAKEGNHHTDKTITLAIALIVAKRQFVEKE